jgi:S1-C subfamily serine protease
VRRLAPIIIVGLFVAAIANSLWADSFRDIGELPPRAGGSMISPGGDPDANLPTESMQPHPAVVRVIVPERGSTSYGSGTLVDVNGEHGLVVTNRHVVADAVSPPTVLFADGFRSLARVVKIDRDWDLAALVIWRPIVDPVPVAREAPRPGELLAIAGYGQGPYRLASGRCTNYLAPNTRLPREMVELAAAARQGDSGGPIFNQRGELAGVLWGEGSGYTTGSYCGRVRQFLSTILPAADIRADESLVAVAPRAIARQRAGMVSTTSHVEETPVSGGWPNSNGTVLSRRPDSATTDSAVNEYGTHQSDSKPSDQLFDWQALAGRTRAEQGKTLLAVIGAVALVLRIRRSVGRPSIA